MDLWVEDPKLEQLVIAELMLKYLTPRQLGSFSYFDSSPNWK
jgi:hypothetical protein